MSENISYIGVFLEGLLSFMSPCVLPLIPLYMSYLTSVGDQKKRFDIKIILATFCFVLGIATVYFLLGLASSEIRNLLQNYQNIITLVGGILLLIIALVQLGFIEIRGLNREYSFKERLDVTKMSYLKAYLLGLVFSFAWTPCIGPMMASVLIMAAGSEALFGNLLILVYTVGLTIPFLIIALFYKKALDFIKAQKETLIKISKAASIIILAFGIYMVYNGTTNIVAIEAQYRDLLAASSTSDEKSDKVMMYDFDLVDQYGKSHTLSDYKGRYIALNFIASWCNYCIGEIDDYKAFAGALDDDEAVALYVMADVINAQNNSLTTQDFIAEHNVEVPVLNDDGTMFTYLGINSFPTVVYIGPDGSYIGYQSGALDTDSMMEIFKLAKERYEKGE